MIFNSGQIYGKVWKVTPAENGKYIDLRITTSEKDAEGNFINSTWFPRAIGHAANSLKGVKEGDRILITKSKFTNESREISEGNRRTYFNFRIIEAKILNEEKQKEITEETKTEPTTPTSAPIIDDAEDCPW